MTYHTLMWWIRCHHMTPSVLKVQNEHTSSSLPLLHISLTPSDIPRYLSTMPDKNCIQASTSGPCHRDDALQLGPWKKVYLLLPWFNLFPKDVSLMLSLATVITLATQYMHFVMFMRYWWTASTSQWVVEWTRRGFHCRVCLSHSIHSTLFILFSLNS